MPNLNLNFNLLPASLALALAFPLAAHADPAADLNALRQQIESMRGDYERRLQALEQRLQAAEARRPATPAAGDGVAAAAPTATTAASVAPAAPVRSGANAFNPAISLILTGTYGRTSREPAESPVPGFRLPPGSEVGSGSRGFSLAESELGLSANIDPWLRGQAHIALAPDDTISVEEAFVQTTSLGRGFTLKAGRFFSGIGYLNEQHAHSWDFIDNPLAYQAFLGNQYGDDGLQLRWLAPTDTFIELGAEIGRGRGFPGSDSTRNGAGAGAVFAHLGGDVGASHSWRAGLSLLNAKATGQGLQLAGAGGGVEDAVFDGRTRVAIADFVWKWAPNGNATRTNLKLQGEYLRSSRSGSLAVDGAAGEGVRSVQTGAYLQAVYQFMPRWRVGVRTERLSSGNFTDPDTLASAATRPRKQSVMLEFNPSEYSRLRLQLARDRSRADRSDNQLLLQYQMSLGAHGAHGF